MRYVRRILAGQGTAGAAASVALVLVATSVCLAGDLAEEKPATPAEAAAPGQEPVPMMSFVANRTLHRGRVLYEDEEAVLLEKPGGGSVRYRKDQITDVRRFQLSPAAYWEEVGDYFMDRLWERTDDLTNYHKARTAYLKSLGFTDRRAVRDKMQRLEAEREQLQRELMRQQELAKAREEAEKARLEKERLEKELNSLPDLQRTVKGQTQALRDLRYAVRDMNRKMKRIEEKIDDLEDRVNALAYSRRVIILLRKDYDSLKEAIERLEKALEPRR